MSGGPGSVSEAEDQKEIKHRLQAFAGRGRDRGRGNCEGETSFTGVAVIVCLSESAMLDCGTEND